MWIDWLPHQDEVLHFHVDRPLVDNALKHGISFLFDCISFIWHLIYFKHVFHVTITSVNNVSQIHALYSILWLPRNTANWYCKIWFRLWTPNRWEATIMHCIDTRHLPMLPRKLSSPRQIFSNNVQMSEKSPGRCLRCNLQSIYREWSPSFRITASFLLSKWSPRDTARKSQVFLQRYNWKIKQNPATKIHNNVLLLHWGPYEKSYYRQFWEGKISSKSSLSTVSHSPLQLLY